MAKIEFRLLCENCLKKNRSCQVSIENLIRIGFDEKKIKKNSNGDTYCVLATKTLEKSESDNFAKQILQNEQDHVVQVIIKPKFF